MKDLVPTKPLDHIVGHVITVGHVATISVSAYFIYLSFIGEFTYFTWHPLLYAIGWVLLMTEAIFMVTRNNVCAHYVKNNWRIRCHWMLESAAIALSSAAFAIAYKNKQPDGEHFISWHAYIGLIAQIFAYITFANGILALFSAELSKFIPPKINKIFHVLTAVVTLALGGVAMVSSLAKGWFIFRTDDNYDIYVACYVALIVGILCCLVQPTITCIRRLTSMKS